MSDECSGADVIVIGAGLSGLVATTLLLEQGRSVVLLEAAIRPGGRIQSLRDAETGDVLGDLGPTWVWPPFQPVVVQWLQRLGLHTFPQFETGNAALDHGPAAPVQFQPLPGQNGIARIAGGPVALIDALVARLPEGVLRTGLAVTAVCVDETGVRVEASGNAFSATRVVVAAPLRVAENSINWSPALPGPLRQAMRAVSVPVHLMVGDEDTSCLNVNIWLKQIMACARLIVFPATGHALNLEEPDLFNNSLLNFLTLVDSGDWRPRDPGTMPAAGVHTALGLAEDN